ncbi:MAG: MoaD/ThiS family protein [Candidatus Methanoperedens sp.]|nr:MoaD/ThiS family protein [Candidatus Methanoperedens sp.]
MEVCGDSTYEDMLESLQINPEIVIVFRNGNPVPLDEKVSQDNVDIIKVVTGG